MANYAKHVGKKNPVNTSKAPKPQMEKDRKDQVENNAGGFVYGIDDWKCLDRFVILGAEGG